MTQDMKHLYKKLSFLLLLMIFSTGVNKTWGQDFSGIYYIANDNTASGSDDTKSYSSATDIQKYYLVPAKDPEQRPDNNNAPYHDYRDTWYSPNHNNSAGDPEKPFLTTFHTNKDNNSVWIVKKISDELYYVIHAATGRYVIYEVPLPNDPNTKTNKDEGQNGKRKTMHLQTPDNEEGEGTYRLSTNVNFQFTITRTGTSETDYIYRLQPKRRSGWYWNPANGNKNQYYGQSSGNKPEVFQAGLVGVYNSESDGGSKWHFENATLAASSITISDVNPENNMVTITVPDWLPAGYNIRYNIGDGTQADPTASTETYIVNSSGTPNEIHISESGILKVVIERYGVVLSESASRSFVTPDDPDITLSNDCSNEISIGPVGPDYYYTIDGSDPSKTNGIHYTGPFLQNTSVTIRAIAYNGNLSSGIVDYTHTARTAPPVITVNGNEISISGNGNIYYTTNGEDPTVSDEQRYTSPFTLTQATGTVTIKAIAVEDGKNPSCPSEASARFAILISSVSDLNSIQATDNCLVTASFDATGYTGNITNFSGTFNGGLFTITGMRKPLFNSVNGGIVKNVILKDVQITSGTNVGAICNEASGDSRIYNCGVLGTITVTEHKTTNEQTHETTTTYTVEGTSSISGTNDVGSIVGKLNDTSRVINCYSYAVITGGSRIGGIVGYNSVSSQDLKPAIDQKTMVMNCMFYGDITDITDGSSKAPIYNGNIITNIDNAKGVGNYNYFRAEARYVQDRRINVYNCALAAEERFLNRFEFFRHLLNSNRALAAWWATGSRDNKDEMMKWELETADRSITERTPYPYPILKPVKDNYKNYIKYPSVVNIDASHVGNIDANNEHYNEGLKLGSLRVYIKGVGTNPAPNAQILKEDGTPTTEAKQRYFDLVITDKDPARYNFNYYKVQLPFYNDCGTNNYKGNRVVTGWKIVEVSDGGSGSFNTDSDDATANNGVITKTPYNFADRNCSNKDLYSVSGRIFNQGAYYDVPEGVTSITIEPYWGQAVYVSDPFLDKVYNQGMDTGYDVRSIGGEDLPLYTDGQSGFNGDPNQNVYTSISSAVDQVGTSGGVYDNAIVLVGNTHYNEISLQDKTKSYTLMSVDLDHDNEPDYSYILRFNSRKKVHPVRIDFLNVIGLGMAQKSTGGTGTYNFGIMQPLGWFEVTNTGLFRVTQLEYDSNSERKMSPVILHGGVIEQWVTCQSGGAANKVEYYHVGGNVWFKEFHLGAHQDKQDVITPHPPISVTGGDYDNFYLTGYYNTPETNYDDNAECYINGGRFGKVAGTGMQGIGSATNHTNGNIVWQIDNADIDEFYAGGINAAHKAEGNITTVISNSRVDLFCGGPKFGDMNTDKKVFTNATNCTFRTFFGAGYGGNSYNRRYPYNKNNVFDKKDVKWNDEWLDDTNPTTITENNVTYVFEGYQNVYKSEYGGVGARIDYQFLPMSNNTRNVARLFVDYVSFSLATTYDVTSNLTNCTITTSNLGRLDLDYCLGNFYGGGSLGNVKGPVKSTLIDCTVEGNVFGGGYSATLPTVSVMNNKFQIEPDYDKNLGAFLEAKLPSTVKYTWDPTPVREFTEEKPAIDTEQKLLRIQSEDEKLDLGVVTGNVTLTISGAKTVIGRSVYGGGEESGVYGNTTVSITDGVIGTKGLEEGVFRDINGNVYGAGKGKKDDYSLGHVKGNATVIINGSPTIYHNVYGGGAYGSVGTISSYSASGIPTFSDDPKGKCSVTINGGTIGFDGRDNGMVFGSSRGDEGNPDEEGSILNKLAWTYQTEVVIGNTNSETPLQIFGSVYGGGENGHNYHNSSVTINRGTIGVEGDIVDEGDPDDPSDDVVKDDAGASYLHRGNVYGGGCGTDVYYTSDTDGKETVNADGDGIYTWYNPLAGVVGGNATVNINGGTIVRCVYGAGSMGSVGIFTFNETTKKMECLEGTGLCTVNVRGGRIGTFDMHMPDDWGYVFGAGRGETKDPTKYLNIEQVQFVNNTEVTISGKALVTGSVYGGAENGHVLNNTHVTIAGGQIGVGEGMTRAYTEDEWTAEDPTTLKECAHWPFQPPYAPYDLLPITVSGSGDNITYTVKDEIEEATDGHTFYGNVFGGGSGYFPYGRRKSSELIELLKTNSGYADGLWLPSAGSVGGNTRVDITGGHILTSVYGGNECTDVEGTSTVNMSGGTVGVPRDFSNNPGNRLVTCYVFGAGKGDQRINFNQWTNVKSTQVNISGKARIFGSTFGGGEDGHVLESVETNIMKGDEIGGVQYPYIGTTGTSGADGNIFGGGRGYSETALTAGAVCGNVNINISGGTMLGTVFGGGRLAPVGTHIVLASSQYYGKLIDDGYKQRFGDKDLYKQIFNEDEDERDPDDVTADGMTHGYITINISGGTIGGLDKTTGKLAASNSSIGDVFGGCKGTLNSDLPFGLSRTTSVNISETTDSKPHIRNNVYGGGEAGNVEEKVLVNISGGTIDGDVYGGGALASTNIKWGQLTDEEKEDADKADYSTFVNLHGGVIGGRVFGGGLGRKAASAVTPIAAIVGGDVTVELNPESSDNCVVKKQIFGCNNLNGTPRGNVTVNIYRTKGWGDKDLTEEKSTDAERKNNKYELDAVYGGGNEAAYVPDDSFTSYDEATGAYTYASLDEDAEASKTNVNIYGCDQTSIRHVYGGGNSAPSPATSVTVHSCYEIGTVFGGGNGADKVDDGTEEGMPNLGANVGYTTYSYVDESKNFHEFYNEDEWPDQESIWSDTKERRRTNYKYGTGKAQTCLYGGTIHNAFGGSNTRGNVCSVAFSALDEIDPTCELKVGQIYGAGNEAFMDAKIEVDLGCISGLDELYGGAVNADVNDNVVLDVTSGSYKKVFGGNNQGGKINGTITVNVKETGCKPVIIEELYGGGNEADYEAPLDPTDETGTRRLQSPVVNIISATEIGKVYGGGRLANITGNPVVTINMEEGVLNSFDDDTTNDETQPVGTVGTVFGGGYKGWVHGDTRVEIGTDPTKKAEITGSVYGGGDNADVIGKTTVIIGKDGSAQ